MRRVAAGAGVLGTHLVVRRCAVREVLGGGVRGEVRVPAPRATGSTTHVIGCTSWTRAAHPVGAIWREATSRDPAQGPAGCDSGPMSNLDARPDETLCHPALVRGPVNRLLEAREVPLGGVRAMHVRRTLPTRDLPLVGAWCFLDTFGPEHVDMRVLPHPHIGLQTVTWPLAGEIHHRDSLGSDVVVRPGELNLMTAGHGVSHSEISLGTGQLLHGVQLWVALPADEADTLLMEPAISARSMAPVLAAAAAR